MYGVSLTSGQPVTIVQKFPDLLQQVIYETCEWVAFSICLQIIVEKKYLQMILFTFFFSSSECDVIHGECIQTYVPYLFLVIPLGPVTLTGQVCRIQSSIKCMIFILLLYRTMFWWSLAARVDQNMPPLAVIQTHKI